MSTRHRRRPKAATAKGRPTTQAERDAITFEPITGVKIGTNKKWAFAHLPYVRMAVLLLEDNPEELKQTWERLTETDEDKDNALDLIESLILCRKDFEGLVELLNVALARSFLTLDRMGYCPENPA
ncbi:hypothetical protein [Bradyrhizobium sp. URHC0002]